MKFELEMKMISSGPDHNYGVQFKLKLKHATFDSIMFDSEDVIETLDVLKNVTYKCQSLIHQQSTGATQKPKVEKYFYNHEYVPLKSFQRVFIFYFYESMINKHMNLLGNHKAEVTEFVQRNI